MTKIQELTKNKRVGRPTTLNTDAHGRVSFVLGPLNTRVEEHMAKAGCSTKAEAIRDLIRIGLTVSEME